MKEKFRDWNPIGDIRTNYKDGKGNTVRWVYPQETLLKHIIQITESYREQRITLTGRQLYYQLVAKGIIPNAMEIYKRISKFSTDARYAGLVNWDAIEDRGRVPEKHAEWDDVQSLIESAVATYRLPRWADQDEYVELYCFDKSTPVITNNGVKNIIDVQIDDEVLTHNGIFKRVTNTIKHHHTGIIYKIKPYYIPEFTCSGNHQFLAVKTNKCRYHNKNCKSSCYRANQCGIAHYKKYSTKWVAARDLMNGDFLVIPRYKTITDVTEVIIAEKKVPLDECFLRVVGLYIAEGSIEPDGRTLKFTLSIDELDFAIFLKNYFNKTFPEVTVSFFENQEQHSRRVLVYSKKICNYFKVFGIGANNKRMPDYFLSLPFNKQQILLNSMIDGDGEKLAVGKKYTTISKTLLYQTKTILDRLGIIAGIHTVKKEKHKLAKYDCHIIGMYGNNYNLGIVTESCIYIPIDKINTKEYDGELYNLTVEDDNSYSIGVLSHNCEKQALESVFKPIANKWHIYFGYNKGYSSASTMYDLAKRIKDKINEGKNVTIEYFGDHDSSGLDMIRDIEDRLTEFLTQGDESLDKEGIEDFFRVHQIALNIDQVRQYNPPPNPAKMTDPRAKGYVEQWGNQSWELDALNPTILRDLAEEAITSHIDMDKYKDVIRQEQEEIANLRKYGEGL